MINFNSNKQSFEAFIESIPEGIMICNIYGEIKFVNSALLQITGYSQECIMDMNIQDMVCNWNNITSNIHNISIQQNIETSVKSVKNILKLNLNIYPLYTKKMDDRIIIVVFKEIKKKRKLEERRLEGKAIYTFDKIIGKNKNFLNIIEYSKKISNSKSTILITGESGTGKEIFAQAIHNYSDRKENVFMAVNCGAIPEKLIESELFGYEEGAFTGAKKGGNLGKFEIANGGTVFLDEIGEMPVEMQVKLLRVIEEGLIVRVGGYSQIPVNVRIIAATNKNLKEEVENRNFRRDLFYRLNVLPIPLPPLRDRKDDICLLVDYYMNRISKKLNKRKIKITSDQMDKLVQYEWPGNIRELENVIEFFINIEHIDENIIQSEGLFKEDNVKNSRIYYDGDFMFNMNLENLEKTHIENVIRKFKGNFTLAAKAMGIGRNTLYRKIKKYNIY
ncbi:MULTISPECIES: sigma-54-dependent Fis family transcriptional regulator [Clostridium]|uniref:Limonene hydroxylase n=1 Tax=Clostridium ragsdalei P11 TaxID=1353534 RepID=A0A1A6ANB9_9CLOT|nr:MULTISPECIES: sigma 54-interacting transcriptional regulator [Clostridium]OBR91457.1 limonene hydroxylase [Clostridium ragsdalei P11]OBR91567.1 limonene hydroxylase [Clostridium ragsdalei P11]QXE21107.1 sigma-54-dependent Fis family transcriptional regulator [Clostridium sp. 001]